MSATLMNAFNNIINNNNNKCLSVTLTSAKHVTETMI